MVSPSLVLHVLPPSPPCLTVEAALAHKQLPFERVVLKAGSSGEEIERIYGPGKRTVPGLLVEGEAVHSSTAILQRLEAIAPEPPLYPEPHTAAIREAELWGDRELQNLGRRLPWGALHFRPEALGTFGGSGPLDGVGTDFAIRFIRSTWKYHQLTAAQLKDDLTGLPAKLARIESLAQQGLIGNERPTAADLQIGAIIRVLLVVGDLQPLLRGTTGEHIARRWFPDYLGAIPPGAYPAGWVPPTA
jgi:glutathione S-transferase